MDPSGALGGKHTQGILSRGATVPISIRYTWITKVNHSPGVPLKVNYGVLALCNEVSPLSPLTAVFVPLFWPDVMFCVEISSCRLIVI